MPPPHEDIERRKSYRFPVSGSRQTAELKAGSVLVPVCVFDESAGGFAVLCEQAVALEPGAVAELFTEGGGFEVQVTSVTKGDSPEALSPEADDAAESSNTAEAAGTSSPVRLGLCRLGELQPPEENRSWWVGVRTLIRDLRSLPAKDPSRSLGAMLAVVAILAGAAAVAFTWYFGRPMLEPSLPWLRSSRDGRPDRSATVHSESSSAKAASGGQGEGRQDAKPRSPRPTAAQRGSQLRDLIRRVPDATVFSLPEVVAELELSPQQQADIRRLVDATPERLRQFELQWSGASRRQRAEKRAELLDQVRQRVLELLSQAQRARWQALRGEAGQTGPRTGPLAETAGGDSGS